MFSMEDGSREPATGRAKRTDEDPRQSPDGCGSGLRGRCRQPEPLEPRFARDVLRFAVEAGGDVEGAQGLRELSRREVPLAFRLRGAAGAEFLPRELAGLPPL